ncbi:hypothetical protein RFI_08016 [Reticulomyxa filosa]|uniref:Glutathione synthetase n=1 Tax=Reticulomyxa filosa TaxID=46433 RepID=X6NS51_RETFI|nr:hypothetical protein RFI_08016 [Reticulomyxa filosa]|eukprot:ETO29110.1 hypothetical protein RFI_08016 [Reticulomyxa filosa]
MAKTLFSGKDYESFRKKILEDEREQNGLVDEALTEEKKKKRNTLDNDQNITYNLFCVGTKKVNATEFKELCEISPIFNTLVDRLSRDSAFLIKCLEGAAAGDEDFTGRLLSLYKKWINLSGTKQQQYQLGIFRSDYMRCSKRQKWSQIELNTISVSFVALSDRVIQLHKLPFIYLKKKKKVPLFFFPLLYFLLERYNNMKFEELDVINIPKLRRQEKSEEKEQKEKPSRGYRPRPYSHEQIAKSLAQAARLVHPDNPIVIMVVQPNEKNTCDQRMIEYALWDQFLYNNKTTNNNNNNNNNKAKFKVKLIRRSLVDIYETAAIDNETNELVLTSFFSPPFFDSFFLPFSLAIFRNKEVRASVVYFRSGYTPKDYPSDKEWIARERIELSSAIKCPSVGYHLLGCKLMQVIFAMPNVLEKYLTEDDSNLLRKCFVGLWSLDNLLVSDKEVEETLSKIKKNYNDYVIKPQREGGGNNFFGEEIPKLIESLGKKEKKKN